MENPNQEWSGFDARIPAWDGQATSWERFKKDFEWWEEGEDLSRFNDGKVNLGSRSVRRQRGLVRSRGESFKPAELRGRPTEYYSEEEPTVHLRGKVKTEGDPLYGIKTVLLPALASMTGLEVEGEKKDLRDVWYKSLVRGTGENVIAWCQRFREHVLKMREKEIEPDDGEQAYMLKDKTRLTDAQT